MIETPQFKRWMAIETGKLAVMEAEAERVVIPDSDIKIEARKAGRWTVVSSDQLT